MRIALTIFLAAMTLLPACGGQPDAPATTTAAAAPPSRSAPKTVKWIDLAVGQCVTDIPQVELGEVDVTVVDCPSPHNAEVFARVAVTVDAAIPEIANRQCGAAFPEYTGKSLENSGLTMTWLVDSNQDRTTIAPTAGPAPSTVICLLQGADGQPLTSSARR